MPVLERRQGRAGPRDFPAASALLVAGILISTGVSLIPLLRDGVSAGDYLREAWLLPLGKREGSGPAAAACTAGFADLWGYSRLVLFYPFLLLYLARRATLRGSTPLFAWIMVWACLEFAGVNMSGGCAGHRVKQVVPVLAVISGMGLGVVFSDHLGGLHMERKFVLLALPVLLVLWLPYQTLKQSAHRARRPQQDLLREMGTWVRNHTAEYEYVQILGESASPILAYSERRAPSRYFSSAFMGRQGALDEVLAAWRTRPPRLVVRARSSRVPAGIMGIMGRAYEELRPQPFPETDFSFCSRKTDP
jgi:hypothetical protein